MVDDDFLQFFDEPEHAINPEAKATNKEEDKLLKIFDEPFNDDKIPVEMESLIANSRTHVVDDIVSSPNNHIVGENISNTNDLVQGESYLIQLVNV